VRDPSAGVAIQRAWAVRHRVALAIIFASVCLLAFWHIPLFSSGGRANNNTQSIWQQLYNAHADVVPHALGVEDGHALAEPQQHAFAKPHGHVVALSDKYVFAESHGHSIAEPNGHAIALPDQHSLAEP